MSAQLRNPSTVTSVEPSAPVVDEICNADYTNSGRRLGWIVVSAQAIANLGFFAVFPFLAGHLHQNLGLSAAAIGVVLGVRTASQQGMFAFGGALADRFGPRTLGVSGSLVRIAGMLLLATAGDFPLVLAGAVLTGLGGALFSPALEATLSQVGDTGAAEHQTSRREWFARFAAIGEIGALLGPALGGLAFGLSFSEVCFLVAGIFGLLAVLLGLGLPRHFHQGAQPGSLKMVLNDRRFLTFAAFFSTQLFAWNQLYFAYPLAISAALSDEAGIWRAETVTALMFIAISMLVALTQIPLSRILEPLSIHSVIPLGFGIIAAAFLLPPFLPLLGVPPLGAVLASAILLAIGHMIAGPTTLAAIADFAGTNPRGAYHGLLASLGGVTVLLGNLLYGLLIQNSVLSWVFVSAMLGISAVAIYLQLHSSDHQVTAHQSH